MKWPTIDELRALSPLPQGYQFDRLERVHVPRLIMNIRDWHPSISVGVNSGYLREEYYINKVFFEGEDDRDIWVIPITFDGECVGIWSVEREIDSLALYGRLIVLAPEHRGVNLTGFIINGTACVGQYMGAAFLYTVVTLQIVQAQRALERAGFRLLGFFPGYDREEISPGVVKRVYQAVYAKLLVSADEVLYPDPKNMTQKAKTLFDLLFADVSAVNRQDGT